MALKQILDQNIAADLVHQLSCLNFVVTCHTFSTGYGAGI